MDICKTGGNKGTRMGNAGFTAGMTWRKVKAEGDWRLGRRENDGTGISELKETR